MVQEHGDLQLCDLSMRKGARFSFGVTHREGLSVEGCRVSFNIGTSIIRIGFGAHYTILTRRSPQNSIGNYLGPHITLP